MPNARNHPLKNWKTLKLGYRFLEPTYYNSLHLGLDIIAPKGTPVVAPENGIIKWRGSGTQGGKTIHFLGVSGCLHRFLHLNSYIPTQKEFKLGERLGGVGNTGELSKGAHLHWDISSSGKLNLNNVTNFIDPEGWVGGAKEAEMWDKQEVIEAWFSVLYELDHPIAKPSDIQTHMKAKTPKQMASGFMAYVKGWRLKKRKETEEAVDMIQEGLNLL